MVIKTAADLVDLVKGLRAAGALRVKFGTIEVEMAPLPLSPTPAESVGFPDAEKFMPAGKTVADILAEVDGDEPAGAGRPTSVLDDPDLNLPSLPQYDAE